MPKTIQYATPPLVPVPQQVPVAFTPIVTSAPIPMTTMAMPIAGVVVPPAGYSTLLTSYPIEILPAKPYSEMEKEPVAAGKSEEKSKKAPKEGAVVVKTRKGCC